MVESRACDEHLLRERLMAEAAPRGLRHVVVTVADWIADPAGLFVADFDLLARIPGLETLDLVCTRAVLGSGFHERIHNWWPGLEEENADAFEPQRSQPCDRGSSVRCPRTQTGCGSRIGIARTSWWRSRTG